MSNKSCTDVYGERLKIGDYVIPVMSEALILGIEGIITNIFYSEEYTNHYITISNENNEVLIENIDSKCYTTKEKFEERKNSNNIYSLTSIPLTNHTAINYEFPDEVAIIALTTKHLNTSYPNWHSYTIEDLYYFLPEKYQEMFSYYYDENDGLYFKDEKEFKENEEAQIFKKQLIKTIKKNKA